MASSTEIINSLLNRIEIGEREQTAFNLSQLSANQSISNRLEAGERRDEEMQSRLNGGR